MGVLWELCVGMKNHVLGKDFYDPKPPMCMQNFISLGRPCEAFYTCEEFCILEIELKGEGLV